MFKFVVVACLIQASLAAVACGPGTQEKDGFCVLVPKGTAIENVDDNLMITGEKIGFQVGNDEPVDFKDLAQTKSQVGIGLQLAYTQGKDIGEVDLAAQIEEMNSAILNEAEQREALSKAISDYKKTTMDALAQAVADVKTQVEILGDLLAAASAGGGVEPFILDVISTAGPAHNHEVPANTGMVQVYGGNLEGLYHPEAQDLFTCVFTMDGEETTSEGTMVKENGFYHINCKAPEIYKSGEYVVSVLGLDHETPMEFKGREGHDTLMFHHMLEDYQVSMGVITFDLVGLDKENQYQCKALFQGEEHTEDAEVMNGKLTCSVPDFEVDANNMIVFSGAIVAPDGSEVEVAEGVSMDFNISACANGKKDGSETDVDCGGDACEGCSPGKACAANSDCEDGLPCNNGKCEHPTDPICRSNQWNTNNHPTRRVSQDGHNVGVICDSGSLQGWYKFTVGSGNMPHSRIAEWKCGTHAPGWINGGVPTPQEGIVNRQVCYAWSGRACNWSNNIQMVNCQTFRLYKVSSTPVCSLRYCVMD